VRTTVLALVPEHADEDSVEFAESRHKPLLHRLSHHPTHALGWLSRSRLRTREATWLLGFRRVTSKQSKPCRRRSIADGLTLAPESVHPSEPAIGDQVYACCDGEEERWISAAPRISIEDAQVAPTTYRASSGRRARTRLDD
jgi:hypothetical protein